MLKTRVIPCLLLKNKGLVKTVKFKEPKYVGDPINAVKIFNDKEVDELFFIDIEASKKGKEPDFDLISKIAREAFMPFGYGGGITTVEQMRKLFYIGVEKVSINIGALENINLVKEAFELFGAQSVVVTVDIKKDFFGKYKVYNHKLKKNLRLNYLEYIKKVVEMGAGEIIINSVDRDGTFKGYDIELMRKISSNIGVPIIALGGAGKVDDLVNVVKEAKVSAVSAGSLFVFHGPHRAVLITYPNKKDLRKRFENIDWEAKNVKN